MEAEKKTKTIYSRTNEQKVAPDLVFGVGRVVFWGEQIINYLDCFGEENIVVFFDAEVVGGQKLRVVCSTDERIIDTSGIMNTERSFMHNLTFHTHITESVQLEDTEEKDGKYVSRYSTTTYPVAITVSEIVRFDEEACVLECKSKTALMDRCVEALETLDFDIGNYSMINICQMKQQRERVEVGERRFQFELR